MTIDLAQRNTQLEGALLLAQKDVQTLREFISKLLPSYGDSKLLNSWELDSFKKQLDAIVPVTLHSTTVHQIVGALRAINMGDEAQMLEDVITSVTEASIACRNLQQKIHDYLDKDGGDLREAVYAIQDQTGGQYTRNYLGATS